MERRISDRQYKNMKMNQFQRNIEKQIMFTDNKDDLTMLASLYVTTGKQIIVNLFGEEAARDMFAKLKFEKKDN